MKNTFAKERRVQGDSPLNIVVFETLSQARLNGNVSRAPVPMIADAVHNGLGGLGL